MNAQVLLVYGKTNHHLGLWNDLRKDSRVILRSTETRAISIMHRIYYTILRYFGKDPRKINYYQYYDIFKIVPKISYLIIIDGALNVIDISELNKCRRLNPNLKIYLYLINSIEAQSPIMKGVRPKINKFNWDAILTFDLNDSQKYGYKYMAFCYYSSHHISKVFEDLNDAYFVGGLKGGRNETIYQVCNFLLSKGVKCMSDLMLIGNVEPKTIKGVYYYRGWKPYDEILAKVNASNCIIEICQKGQTGATLRYFEAVCMNKKLLTNNKNIINFPFYNQKWMKIFSSVDDIDAEWVKKREPIDYKYNGEFSPTHLIDIILNAN